LRSGWGIRLGLAALVLVLIIGISLALLGALAPTSPGELGFATPAAIATTIESTDDPGRDRPVAHPITDARAPADQVPGDRVQIVFADYRFDTGGTSLPEAAPVSGPD
jgi:hypothetical protein